MKNRRHSIIVGLTTSVSTALLSACGGSPNDTEAASPQLSRTLQTPTELTPIQVEIEPQDIIGKNSSPINTGLMLSLPTQASLKLAIQAGFLERMADSSNGLPGDVGIQPIYGNMYPIDLTRESPQSLPLNNNDQNATRSHNPDTIQFNGQHFFISEKDQVRIVSAGSSADNLTAVSGYLTLTKPQPTIPPSSAPTSSDASPTIDPLSTQYKLPEIHLSENHIVAVSVHRDSSFSNLNTSSITLDIDEDLEFHIQGFAPLDEILPSLPSNKDSLPSDHSIPPRWSMTIQGQLVGSIRKNNHVYVVSRSKLRLPHFDPIYDSEEQKAENEQRIDNLTLTDILPRVKTSFNDTPQFLNPENCYLKTNTATTEALTFLSQINMADGAITTQSVFVNKVVTAWLIFKRLFS